jgi:hypothetical protein
MPSKECLSLICTLTVFLTLSPVSVSARNCIKGKPCGNGCIAQNKQCHLTPDNPTQDSQTLRLTRDPGVLRLSHLKMPRVYRVVSDRASARQAPGSGHVTGRYRQGQSVFVYEVEDNWARVSNMSPQEWIELKHLELK